MGRLNKEGIKERKRIFKEFKPKNKSESSIVNAFAQMVADHKTKKKK